MDGGRIRRMRRLIRWNGQMPAPFVSSAAAVGAIPRRTCGRPPTTWAAPATAMAVLASAVRVQEDGGKSMSSAGRAG
jgi:hypothetical protein